VGDVWSGFDFWRGWGVVCTLVGLVGRALVCVSGVRGLVGVWVGVYCVVLVVHGGGLGVCGLGCWCLGLSEAGGGGGGGV